MADFYNTYLPYAQDASQRTGLDPRLILAQAALESGWGKHAPGNNMFGIKSHGQPGGNTLPTTEYGPDGAYRTSDSFRGYGKPEDSFGGYADFMLSNPRYKDTMGAQGLEAQAAALGKSGYATDPNYGNSVLKIAQGFPGGDGVSAINTAAGINPQGQMPQGALGFANQDQDPGALSQQQPQQAANPGVLFQGEQPNKLHTIGSTLANIGSAIAGISNPAQANSLHSIAQGIEAQNTGNYQYQLGPNGQLIRMNKKTNAVDSIAIPDAQKESFKPIMGKDAQGNPTMVGTFNQTSGEYKPIGGTAGQPPQSQYGEAVTPENPYGLPADVEDLKGKGPAGTSLYNQLQGIKNGNVQYPTGSRVNKQMEMLRNAAALYFPDLNANDFAARKRYQEENVKQTPGTVGGNKIALNHSYNLIGQISDKMVGLDNSDNGYIPAGIQSMYNNAKNQRPANHANANSLDTQLMPALAGETGKLYYGQGAGGQAEREKISKGLTSSGTKQDQIAGLETALATLQARETDLDKQAQTAYGKDWEKYAARNDEGHKDIEKITKNLGILKGTLNKDGTPKSIPQNNTASPQLGQGWSYLGSK